MGLRLSYRSKDRHSTQPLHLSMMLLSVPPTTTLSPPTILLLHLHILTTIASVGVLGAPPTNNKTDHRQEPRQTPLKYYNKQIEYSGPEFFNG